MFSRHDDVMRLFPSGILMRDSQSFAIGSDVTSNVDLICSDGLTCMYTSRDRNGDVSALSLGTTVPCGHSANLLRHCIDYYGTSSSDVIQHHVIRHLCDVMSVLNYSHGGNITHVTCHLYVPSDIMTSLMRDQTFDFVAHALNLSEYVNRKRSASQCVVDVIDDPRVVFRNKPKM